MAAYMRVDKAAINRKDEIRTQFQTREGLYKLMNLSEYSRPSRFPQNGPNTSLLRVSFVSVVDPSNSDRLNDLIAFNISKELFAYVYNGVRKAADLTHPIEKKTYKGPSPTCHEFNCYSAKSDNVTLIVGFTHGQIQLIEIMMKECTKLFNEERQIDSTKVTCVRWVPHLPNQFLAAHASGYLYLYDEQLPCSNVAPTYNVLHEGSGFAIQNYSSKSVRNPLYRWFFDGGGAIHEFAFSPCARYLAIVFANGQLRIFNYHRMELLGVMRSYFGGLRCVAWSPDGRYVATGGEDDLITVWSFDERRIVCRGAGHHSWINSIAFDPYTTSIPAGSARKMENGDGLQHRNQTQSAPQSDAKTPTPAAGDGMSDHGAVSYRLGTVGDDTFLCLWELTEDVLKQRPSQTWNSDSASSMSADQHVTHPNGDLPEARGGGSPTTKATPVVPSNASPQAAFTATALSQNFSSLQVSDQVPSKDAANNTVKRQLSSTATTTSLGKSAGAKNRPKSSNNSNRTSSSDDGANACKLGSPSYPRLNDVPLLEPMVCKKIAGDRLTALVFREDCIVTACQDGIVSTWSRPGRVITSGCS